MRVGISVILFSYYLFYSSGLGNIHFSLCAEQFVAVTRAEPLIPVTDPYQIRYYPRQTYRCVLRSCWPLTRRDVRKREQ